MDQNGSFSMASKYLRLAMTDDQHDATGDQGAPRESPAKVR